MRICQGWGQVQLTKYSNTPSTRNIYQVQVLIFFKVLKYIKYFHVQVQVLIIKLVTLYYNCVLYVGKLWQSITSLFPDYLFVLTSGWTYRVKSILDGQNKGAFPKSSLLYKSQYCHILCKVNFGWIK